MSLEFTVVVSGQIAYGGTKISTVPGMAPPSAIQRVGNGFSGGCGHRAQVVGWAVPLSPIRFVPDRT